MPTYEYNCECSEDEIIEVKRSIKDPEVAPECPKCGKVTKKIYRTFGIEFKGFGWGKTGP